MCGNQISAYIRPHSSLGKLTPEEFLVQQTDFYQEEVVL